MSHLTSQQLKAYLNKIDYHAQPKPDLSTLKMLQTLHLQHIPFGVIDVHLKSRKPNINPIPTDLNAVFQKLVVHGRDGYCLEHNELFYAVLKKIGFKNLKRYVGTVLNASGDKQTPNHEVIIVTLQNQAYLTDVGFAPKGSLEPLALIIGTVFKLSKPKQSYRFILDKDDDFVLQRKAPFGWQSLYAFNTRDVATKEHLKRASAYVSTQAASPFNARLFVTQNTPSGSKFLSSEQLSITDDKTTQTQVIQTPKDFLCALEKHFQMSMPKEARFDAKNVLFHYNSPTLETGMLKRIKSDLKDQGLTAATQVGPYLLRKR